MSAPGSMSLRRFFTAVLLAVALTGCGFSPMYGEKDVTPLNAQLTDTMAAIQITPIADYDGVQLRQNLREGMQPHGPANRYLYELDVQLRSVTQELGVRRDATSSRANRIYTARFALLQNGKRVFADQVQSVVSYNIADNQYATVTSVNDAGSRAIKQISEEIKTRIGIFLQTPQKQAANQ
jgi:LPS-assembly lipoprotein